MGKLRDLPMRTLLQYCPEGRKTDQWHKEAPSPIRPIMASGIRASMTELEQPAPAVMFVTL